MRLPACPLPGPLASLALLASVLPCRASLTRLFLFPPLQLPHLNASPHPSLHSPPRSDGDAMPLPVLSKRVSAAAAAMAAAAQQMPTWVDTSADVLAMFQQQPLLPLPAGDASGGSNSSGSSGRRGRARSQALQLPLLPSGGFSFAGLPPMPEPAGPGSFNPAAAAAAAAALGGLPPAGLFAPLAPAPTAFNPAAAAAFMMNPVAAAAATIAAAASLVEQQQQRQAQLEESMADAVSCPAAEPAATAPSAAAQPPAVAAATPGAFKMASALTSHLSDVVCATDSEMHGEKGAQAGVGRTRGGLAALQVSLRVARSRAV